MSDPRRAGLEHLKAHEQDWAPKLAEPGNQPEQPWHRPELGGAHAMEDAGTVALRSEQVRQRGEEALCTT